MSAITPIRMPKWGLSMQEGKIVEWWKKEGAALKPGDDLVDIETSKITNVCEAPGDGVLRRIVAQPGETLPVGALIGVIADNAASDADVDAFVADFQSRFVPEAGDGDSAGALALGRVAAGEHTIHYGRTGLMDGTPVVLLHGYSGDMNNWLFNLDALTAKAPVIALDLPGHGGSSKAVGDGSLATLAAAVAAALDALGVTHAHLIGHSLGGAIAARLAADAPGRIASLTLICPASLPGTVASAEFLTGIGEAQRARDLKPYLEMLFSDPSLVSKDMIEGMIQYKRLDGVEEALGAIRARLLDARDTAALTDDLGRIAKATIIASHNDRIVGAPDAAALPGGFTLHWIDEAGHMPHLEQAAKVNAILAALL